MIVIEEYDPTIGAHQVFYASNNVKLGEFYKEVDGYWVFSPELRGGFWSEGVLSALADELENMNADWDEEVSKLDDNI